MFNKNNCVYLSTCLCLLFVLFWWKHTNDVFIFLWNAWYNNSKYCHFVPNKAAIPKLLTRKNQDNTEKIKLGSLDSLIYYYISVTYIMHFRTWSSDHSTRPCFVLVQLDEQKFNCACSQIKQLESSYANKSDTLFWLRSNELSLYTLYTACLSEKH